MGLFLVVDFFGVGYLKAPRKKGVIRGVKCNEIENEEILSEVQTKFWSLTLYQPNLLCVRIPCF